MAYRRPGVTVIQEFIGLVPALAAFTLPCVAVGPAYQIVNADTLGGYDGTQQAYAYASLLAGGIVDLAELDPEDPFPQTKKPVSVLLKSAKAEIVALAATGGGSLTSFVDPTTDIFEFVQASDLVSIVPTLAITIVPAKTDGGTFATALQRNRLAAGTVGDFVQVKVGDIVTVTGGTDVTPGLYNVIVKVSDSLLILDADLNDGGGNQTDCEYSIAGDRGVANAGDWRVKSKTDYNTLVLESPLFEAEVPLSYSIVRPVGTLTLARVDSLPGNGFFRRYQHHSAFWVDHTYRHGRLPDRGRKRRSGLSRVA